MTKTILLEGNELACDDCSLNSVLDQILHFTPQNLSCADSKSFKTESLKCSLQLNSTQLASILVATILALLLLSMIVFNYFQIRMLKKKFNRNLFEDLDVKENQ